MEDYKPRLLSSQIKDAERTYPVIVITGPRQSGKTCLCRHLYPDYHYVNLEHIVTRTAAIEDPVGFLEDLGDQIIIDEVQHVPELLSLIQVRVDENRKLRYVLTGSSNFSLLKTISQSLAGRVALFTLLPFSFKEMDREELDLPIERLLWQGQYPGVLIHHDAPGRFYRNYYNTYIERDLRDLLRIKNLLEFDKFVRLLATRVGSEFNASAIAREVGVTSKTISEWFSMLATSYIAFQLPPYFNNLSKRLTKMPKIYFYDTGLMCYLLGVATPEQLETHPLKGAIFENMAVCEMIKNQFNNDLDANLYFYREQSGKEVDAVLVTPQGLNLYEMKAGKMLRPDYRENMNALKRLLPNINSTCVIYDGESYPPICINIRDI